MKQILIFTSAAKQWCASKTKAVVFAPSTTFRFAITLGQFLATFWEEIGPQDLPHITSLGPSPASRTLYFWFTN